MDLQRRRVATWLNRTSVKMLDGEALVVLLVRHTHALELVLGRPPGRGFANPPIDQTVRARLLVALAPATQWSARSP